MNMQLRVVHTTEFVYEGRAAASYNQARLTPMTTAGQIAVHSRLEISPKPWTLEYRDYFGTAVTAFEVVDPHDHMTVRATSTVQTNRLVAATLDDAPALTWEAMAERDVADRWTEYLTLPPLVAPPADFVQRARQVAADHETPRDAARDLALLVHDEVDFDPAATDAQTPAARVWQLRAGVCQDMVHLLIGGLRAVGIPARYVSGYLHPDADPQVGVTVTGSSHAWVEWFDGAWRGFDVCNLTDLDDRYVTVATGRDYDDVKPLSGIYSGPPTSRLDVSVQITRLA